MGGTSSWRPSVVTLCGDVGYVGWCGGGFGDGGDFGGDDIVVVTVDISHATTTIGTAM